MTDVDSSQSAPHNANDLPNKNGVAAKIYVAVIVLLVVACIALFAYEQYRFNSLNSKYTSLQTSDNSLQEKNRSLTNMVSSLQKAYTALKDAQKANDGSINSASISPLQKTSSFSIDKIQEEPESNFGVTGSDSNTELLVATVTIKNLSSANQTYSAYEFSAITDSGAVKRTPGWVDGPPVNANFWVQSNVAPGGTDTEEIAWLYSDYKSLGFTTIEFNPPDSTPTQSVSLPALSN